MDSCDFPQNVLQTVTLSRCQMSLFSPSEVKQFACTRTYKLVFFRNVLNINLGFPTQSFSLVENKRAVRCRARSCSAEVIGPEAVKPICTWRGTGKILKCGTLLSRAQHRNALRVFAASTSPAPNPHTDADHLRKRGLFGTLNEKKNERTNERRTFSARIIYMYNSRYSSLLECALSE